MADLTGKQIPDGYPNIVTIGATTDDDPTTGTLENGKGTNLTSVTVDGAITADGAVTVNESGGNNDFRVEGDTDQNLLFVDASTDRVGIGTNTPNALLQVDGTLNATSLGGTLSTAAQTNITSVGTLTGLDVSGATGLDGGVTINESGANVDLRVEGNTEPNLLFTDANTDRVAIGTNSPSVTLHVNGTDAIKIPVGTTAERPTGADGFIRYNSDNDEIEAYADGEWVVIEDSTSYRLSGVEAYAIQLLRIHNPDLVFSGFANTSTSTPSNTANKAYIATEDGTIFGISAVEEGQIIVDDGTNFIVENLTTAASSGLKSNEHSLYPLSSSNDIDLSYQTNSDIVIGKGLLDIKIFNADAGHTFSVYQIAHNWQGGNRFYLKEYDENGNDLGIAVTITDFTITPNEINYFISEVSGTDLIVYFVFNYEYLQDDSVWTRIENTNKFEDNRVLITNINYKENNIPPDAFTDSIYAEIDNNRRGRKLNYKIKYPLYGSTSYDPESSSTIDRFVGEGILFIKILNAKENHKYKIEYVAADHVTAKDRFWVGEYDSSDNKVRDLFDKTVQQDYDIDINSINAINRVADDGDVQIIGLIDFSLISNSTWNNSSASYKYFDDYISEDCYVYRNERFENKFTELFANRDFSKNLIYREDSETVYIASKYDDNNDLIIKMAKAMDNDLMTFEKVSVVNNNYSEINDSLVESGEMLIEATQGDIIGPYRITGRTDFVGGNHGIEGGYELLTSAYTAGSSTMDVADGTKFVATGGRAATDGTSGNKIFFYTGVTGNQLTGVSGLNINLTTSNSVQSEYKSATTIDYSFYADGKEIETGVLLKANELQVVVKNEIYDPNSLNYTTGDIDVGLYENVYYRISNGSIEVMLENDFQKSINLDVYHGMQATAIAWVDKVYIANGEDTNIVNKTTYPDSGNNQTYTPDKVILSDNNFDYNISIYYDHSSSYYINIADYMNASTGIIDMNTNGKLYYNLIDKDSAFVSGDREWWRGVYTFFKNPTLTDASYAYPLIIKGHQHLAFDFHTSGEEVISVPDFHSTDAEIIREDAALTIDTDIKPTGLRVSASGYGEGLVKLNK